MGSDWGRWYIIQVVAADNPTFLVATLTRLCTRIELKNSFLGHFGTVLSLFGLLWGQIWCHYPSLAGSSAKSFIPVAHFNALLAHPNIVGTYRVSNQSKMATKWAKNMCFSTPVSPG